jgi:phenylacetate-CoA ligase
LTNAELNNGKQMRSSDLCPDRQNRYRSAIEGIDFPPLLFARGARLLSVLGQLEQSQWWPTEQLQQKQREQLLLLLNHAVQTAPYYQQRLGQAGFHPGQPWDDGRWLDVPILKRQDVQAGREQLKSRRLPAGHGNLHLIQSSGSTGRPVQVLGTGVTRFYWDLITLRDHQWHQRVFTRKLVAIRPDRLNQGQERFSYESWGPPVDLVYHTGPSVIINSRVDVRQQMAWLQEDRPAYLLSLPSNLRELARLCNSEGITLHGLEQVRSYGETVSQDLRDRIGTVWDVGLIDMYSSQEVGYMALQCPNHEHYHVQSETVLLEVLDENGERCGPGEVGRVVVTALHNFAMPLIRYEVGDFAEVGEACPCGRGLPVLRRIVGRSRNMVRTPDGRRYWPSFPASKWLAMAPIRQIQLHQVALDTIEVLLVMEGSLTEGQRKLLTESLQDSLNYPFAIILRPVNEIPVKPNGKYEDFICEL